MRKIVIGVCAYLFKTGVPVSSYKNILLLGYWYDKDERSMCQYFDTNVRKGKRKGENLSVLPFI